MERRLQANKTRCGLASVPICSDVMLPSTLMRLVGGSSGFSDSDDFLAAHATACDLVCRFGGGKNVKGSKGYVYAFEWFA